MPRIWAHRGDSAHVTENTLAAFEAARIAGADGVEFDVRLDGDGVPVVFHDDDLGRLAGRANDSVERLSSANLATVELLGGHRIPTLVETLEACGDLELNVELKVSRPGRGGALVAAVAQVLSSARQRDRILVSSFDPIALGQLRRRDPQLARGCLFERNAPWPIRRGGAAYLLAVAAVHPDRALVTAARVQHWHRRGWAVNVWTVDEPEALRRLTALGVDGVFCNDPGAARLALDGGSHG